MVLQVLLLALSIVMLYYGAEFALEAAEKIGMALGLSPLVIGLLIVGFGTSLPEFFVSQISALDGNPQIALGNIVGSNIANLFLILGISGFMTELFVQRKEIKIQFYLHLGITSILAFVLFQNRLYPWAAGLFGAFFAFYLYDTFKQMMKQRHLSDYDNSTDRERPHAKEFLFLAIGFVLLYLGGELLVDSGTELAKAVGVSSYVISAVFVAFGTSFPELVTAIMACIKKKNTDLITGNIIGSNIFNVAFVLGSLSFYNIPIENDFTIEIVCLLFASLFLIGLTLLKKNFGRLSGLIFLGFYVYSVFNWVS
ncbi:calcium/sodium antiporter [Bacteriovorax sp. Seq25_V]|uniref:calcium/sodium antiporter n=1 Tax=Bacteriovorax sp. Seq25_V TaxID=1201288 RepID=UPI00038A1063|nr:calcium/sodium antiporter [Bacteriovorax sp. Seq25_V]EQC47122.1 K+-dependent Na+/Ca+ exchanger family protein [Bacteriovorax sp. Seq25_V]